MGADRRLRPFRGPIVVFACFLVVQAVSALVLFVQKMGPGADAVRAFYLGSEARFTAPRTLPGLLEVALPHLLAIPLVVFAAAHLVAFAGMLRRRVVTALTAVSFASALAGIGAGFVVRFLTPRAAPIKIVAFAGMELTLLLWVALLASMLFAITDRATAAEPGGASAAASRTPARDCRP
jgi:hypothetical protein